MLIKIQCPVCNARNELTPEVQSCRRCQENLSLLYELKAWSYRYRLYMAQYLGQGASAGLKQILMKAYWLCKEK